jgi:hypothetical protein
MPVQEIIPPQDKLSNNQTKNGSKKSPIPLKKSIKELFESEQYKQYLMP